MKSASQCNDNGACSYTPNTEAAFTLGTELQGLTEGEQEHSIFSDCHLKLFWDLTERTSNLRVRQPSHPMQQHMCSGFPVSIHITYVAAS